MFIKTNPEKSNLFIFVVVVACVLFVNKCGYKHMEQNWIHKNKNKECDCMLYGLDHWVLQPMNNGKCIIKEAFYLMSVQFYYFIYNLCLLNLPIQM